MKKDKPFEQPKKNPMHPSQPTNKPGHMHETRKDPMRDTSKQHGQPNKNPNQPYSDRKS